MYDHRPVCVCVRIWGREGSGPMMLSYCRTVVIEQAVIGGSLEVLHLGPTILLLCW